MYNMSFWRNFGFQPISHIESILDRDYFTLEDLFDEDELLQECKTQNKRLIEFLIKPESLNGMFEFITKEAPEDAERKRKENYPYLASEILCMDIQSLIDAIYKDDTYLEQLYDYLNKPNFNLGLAAYTSKVAINFLGRKTIDTMAYIKKQENIVEKFIKHLDKSPVVEILLKIISIEEYQGGAGTLEWLDKQNLIGGIIDEFDPSLDSEYHENASFILSEIVEMTRNITDSPLLERLESEEMIKKLYNYILQETPLGTAFLYGLTVIIRLLRRDKDNCKNELVTAPLEQLSPLFKESLAHIEEFNKLLKQTSDISFTTTTGPLSPPLGFHRLKVIEFFADLINSRYLCIDKKIMELDILSTCLELFFKYQWNNLLHSQIHQICQIILYSENDELKVCLLKDAKLLDRIIDADQANTNELKNPKGIRFGYMGFLNSIAQSVCDVAKSSDEIRQIVDENPRWATFVTDSLEPVLNLENEPLGEFKPSLMTAPESAEEDDDQFENGDDGFDNYENAYQDQMDYSDEDDYDNQKVNTVNYIDEDDEEEDYDIRFQQHQQQQQHIDEEEDEEEDEPIEHHQEQQKTEPAPSSASTESVQESNDQQESTEPTESKSEDL
ncbi:hypothetical protein DICPUDRAFT_92107 [Dictyostelium purpureum]|uniref:Serine/threonine-protein phosphatase 4 regulatory subunit 3-like central domain-containing protein n=1 Tax=Dictyostelium purpureum TaxID=5786 RepID=F0ZM59_DICPU|nr:uncharacterized protein DICPUDRAFT_92107 [Dictyostelium purpureum]EGC34970.1 hypothetical protein DICPUDRAFT_92107 [Dictyostelium purpureum]|eukprot:XP_003288495.1 hypothetical protein DICPUDRAFT_92107 [Dictyostelium purpureum]